MANKTKSQEVKSATRKLNEARCLLWDAQGAVNSAERECLVAHGWTDDNTNMAVGLYWTKKSGKTTLFASRKEALRIEDIV